MADWKRIASLAVMAAGAILTTVVSDKNQERQIGKAVAEQIAKEAEKTVTK